MIASGRAAAMLPRGGGCCPAAAVCSCAAVRSPQAGAAQATKQQTCVCSETDVLSSPAAPHVLATERRPAFHLAPAGGWINDPNGPLLHNGTYHLFHQHVPNSSEWQWGLVWGHAKSQDLVNWTHLPVALQPTPNGLDQDGCFSGCATLDVDGRPTLLYTGVIRKAPGEIEPDVSPQHESQIIAVATDLDDPDLKHWQKLPGSFLPHPPADMDLTGWRDPFVLQRPTASCPWWYVMVGAGVRNKCGTALVYRSKDLTEGWQYVGPLCESPASHMWECPVMARLTNAAPSSPHTCPQGPGQQLLQRHMLSVSPDYCVNMIQYYLGDYADGRFDLDGADGPYALDLGDIMYAPNVLTDKHGRTVLWAWMQEKQHLRLPGSYNSACCLCVPRVLYLSPDGKSLRQEPLPELTQLHQQQGAWHIGAAAGGGGDHSSSTSGVQLPPKQPLRLGGDGFSSSSADLELQIAKGGADAFALVLHPFGGAAGAAGAAICYCWSTNTLQVVYSTDPSVLERTAAMPLQPRPHHRQPGPDPVQLAAAEAAAAEPGAPMRCGGALRAQDARDADGVISLRVLLDGSCLEVFCAGTGEALGTRVYRGDELPLSPPHASAPEPASAQAAGSPAAAAVAAAAAAGAVGWEQLFAREDGSSGRALTGGDLELVSFGPGPATLLSCSAWQMSSMWQQQQAELAPAVAMPTPASTALPVPAATAVTAAAAEVLQGLVASEAVAVAAAAASAVAPVVLPIGGLWLDLGAAAAGEVGAAARELAPLSPLSPSGAGAVLPVGVQAS